MRRGNNDEQAFKAYFNVWMKAMPTKVEGRRQMPQFNLSEQEIEHLADFLIWTSRINTNNWPPNVEG